jgi:plastocyanin
MSALTVEAMFRLDHLVRNRPRRSLVSVATIIVGAVALISCTSDSSAASHAHLQVNLGRFVLEPAVLQAPPGDLELRVTNVDSMVHDLVVHGKGTRPLAPGQTQVLHIPDVAAGEYRMWCDVPGHAQAGQVGTLVVKAATNETAASS